MATPVISPIGSPLNFIVNIPVNFNVSISNNPSRVVLRGSVEEFYWSWEEGVFYLRGTPTRARSNKRLTIYATDPNDPENIVESTFTYNIQVPVPIITQIPAQRIVRGVEQSIFIPIANDPSEVIVEGLLIGLDHRMANREGQRGVEIIGRVPINAQFTRESGRFWVTARNADGETTWGSIERGGLEWTLARATVPDRVTNLRASVSGTTVTLTWIAPADGGTPLTGYEYRINGGHYISTHSTLPRVELRGISGQPSYRAEVRALNGLGAGAVSRAVSFSTIPPRAPSGSIALVAEAGDREVVLTWTDPEDLGLPGASYEVYRGSTRVATTFGTTYTDTGRTNGTSYAYYVQAVNPSGRLRSNTVSATPQAPRAPSGTITLSATAGNGQVALRWNHPSDRGVPTARYRIYRDNTFIWELPGTETSYTDTGRTNGTSYAYYVQAYNETGTLNSNTVSATPVAPVAPVINAISNISRTSGYSQFTLQASLSSGTTPVTWSISGIAGASISTSGLITIPAGLSIATYTATVTATNSVGSDTERFSVVVAAQAVAPSGTITLSATAGNGQVVLSWGHPSNRGTPTATYTVYRRTGTSGSYSAIRSGLTGTFYTDTNVTNDTTYQYYVQASNSAGSINSNADTATPAAVAAVAPSGTITLTLTAGDGQIALNWNHPSNRGTPTAVYSIGRRDLSAGIAGYTRIADGLTGTSYTDTGLTNGTTYQYTLQGYNSAGTVYANRPTATPSAAVAPVINAIANVSQTDGYSQFTIQASLSSGTLSTWSISGIAGATISNSGLITIPAGLSVATHTATVTATNTAGSDTEQFSVVVAAAAVAPSGTITLSATAGDGQVELSWNHPSNRGNPAATYRVYRGTTLVATVSGTSYTDTGRTNGTSYSYYIQAFNTAGSVNSNTASATPTAAVVAPSGNIIFRAGGGVGQTALSWNHPRNRGTPAATYTVFRRTGTSGSFTAIASGLTGTSYTDTNVTNDTTYQYYVRAINSAGRVDSNTDLATPMAAVVAPSGTMRLTITSYPGILEIMWTVPNLGNPTATYTIYRRTGTSGEFTAIQTGYTRAFYRDSDVEVGNIYFYYIRVENTAGGFNSNRVGSLVE